MVGDHVKQKLLEVLTQNKQGLTTQECAQQLGLERHTLAKYLETLRGEGLIDYREIGKAKVWTLTSSPLLTILSKNDPLGQSIKELFNQLDEKIFVVTKDRKVVWSNTQAQHLQGMRCFENYHGTEICQGCPAERAFQSGRKETASLNLDHAVRMISTVPIKDQGGNTVAFLEVVKEA